MATYGYDRYGTPTVYGPSFAGSGFDLSPLTGRETRYGQVTLTWSVPSQAVAWSRIRIVRSSAGFPINEYDGKNAFEFTSASTSTAYTDRGLTQGQFYYYSFFVETDLSTWNSGVTYTKGAVVKDVGGAGYVSLADKNLNNAVSNTTYWAPVSITKKWVLSGQVVVLVSKRYDHTTSLYQGLPSAYRSDYPDWVEPDADQYGEYLDPVGNWPDLARFLAVFGFHLDGIQTKTDVLSRITDLSLLPEWYLDSLSGHLGFTAEKVVSARLKRLRLKNAAALARSRGTLTAIASNINARLGWDATVKVGKNLMLSEDSANAGPQMYPTYDAAARYTIGDRVIYGSPATSPEVFEALQTVVGTPPTPGADTASWKHLRNYPDTNVLFRRETASVAGWAPTDRTVGRVRILVGAASPYFSRNVFEFTNFSAATASPEFTSIARYYAPAWLISTAYKTDDLVTYNSQIWQAQKDTTGTTPGTDYKTWALFIDRVPSTVDPRRVFEDGIPVTAGQSYTVSAYTSTYSGLSSNTVVYTFDWYDAAGVLLSSSVGSSVPVGGGSFTLAQSTATSPTNAAYAGIRMQFPALLSSTDAAPNSNGQIQVRMFNFEQAASATGYEIPRSINVTVKPDRANLVTNPGAETNITGWNTYACSVARVTTQFDTGSASFQMTANGGDGPILYNYASRIPVTPGRAYSASARFKAAATPRNCLVAINFQGPSDTGLGSIGQPLGASGLDSTTAWSTRKIENAIAPAGAAYMDVYCFYNDASIPAGEIHFIDSVIANEGATVLDYFDGNSGSNYSWAGTANNSKSYYYEGWNQRRFRVDDVIRESVPLGLPYTKTFSDV